VHQAQETSREATLGSIAVKLLPIFAKAAVNALERRVESHGHPHHRHEAKKRHRDRYQQTQALFGTEDQTQRDR
jgi:hypothetical protein